MCTEQCLSKNHARIPTLFRDQPCMSFSCLFKLANACKEMCPFAFPAGWLLSVILAIGDICVCFIKLKNSLPIFVWKKYFFENLCSIFFY